MSVSPMPVLITKSIGKKNEFCVPLTIYSVHRPETIATTAIIDSGAGGSFINWALVRKHRITTHELTKPFHITTADGSHSKKWKDHQIL
jgi:hypothetical protein